MTLPGRTTPCPEGGQTRVLQDLDSQEKGTRCMAYTPLDLPFPSLGGFHSGGWYVFPGMSCCFSGSSIHTTPPHTHTHIACVRGAVGTCTGLPKR